MATMLEQKQIRIISIGQKIKKSNAINLGL